MLTSEISASVAPYLVAIQEVIKISSPAMFTVRDRSNPHLKGWVALMDTCVGQGGQTSDGRMDSCETKHKHTRSRRVSHPWAVALGNAATATEVDGTVVM